MRRINGEERIKTAFLFLPKTLRVRGAENRETETRWLERASWKQYWYAHGLDWMDVSYWED